MSAVTVDLVRENKRLVRTPISPMDKCTVVSIYPKLIRETKPTIQPGLFIIEAGSYEKPAVLVVGASTWWREIDAESTLIEIPNSSIQIANSVVTDYCNGLLGCNMQDAMPGLFYVENPHTSESIKKNFKHLLDQAQARQRRWYENLVKTADSLWSRTNGNPLCIGDDMRMAADQLGLRNKDWLRDFTMLTMIPCVACGALRDPHYPICRECKAIADPKKAEELGLVFSK